MWLAVGADGSLRLSRKQNCKRSWLSAASPLILRKGRFVLFVKINRRTCCCCRADTYVAVVNVG